jgi:hypothetical protein
VSVTSADGHIIVVTCGYLGSERQLMSAPDKLCTKSKDRHVRIGTLQVEGECFRVDESMIILKQEYVVVIG